MKANAIAVGLFLLVPASAWASLDREETPLHYNATLAVSAQWLDDATLQDVYGTGPMPGLEGNVGLVLWKRALPVVHLETNLTFGIKRKAGAEIGDDSGEPTGETSTLTLAPVGAELLLGIDALREQWVVPYGAASVFVVPWWEHSGSSGDTTSGGKFGWKARAGLAILLDAFEPARAHAFDASDGINDTYLTVEGAITNVPAFGDTSGLSFSGQSLSVGLKFLM